MIVIFFFCTTMGYAQIDQDAYRKINEAARRIEQKVANLPMNEKKINKLILDKVNRMIEDDAVLNYSGSEMVKRYSDDVARVDGQGRIKVKISLPDTTSLFEAENLKNDLEKGNIKILNVYFPEPYIKWYPEITCLIQYQKVKEIARDIRIANITVSAEPVCYSGSALTEGDSALFADVARAQHDVDGGRHHQVKVGVISNGIQGYDTSQASYDLPAISWIAGHDTAKGKEGRAMMEIVHDLAPGADLMFGSARYGAKNSTEMKNTISNLISYNCRVIVDDIGWPTDPWFLDGPLAQHISFWIQNNNITYVSSAGNHGKAMWTGLFSDDGQNWLDFYQGQTADIQNRIFVYAQEQVAVFLQWQDNWQDAANNYDLYVFDQFYPNNPVGTGGQTVQGTGQNQPPLEVVTFVNDTGLDNYYNIQVKKVSGVDVYLKVDAYPKDLQYTHPSSQTHPSEQVVGHTAAAGVISVAAYPWYDDTMVEDFSVRGPTVLRDEWGYTETRDKPTITATDWVETSVPGFISFGGTSAAAPHIAAIAALYYDKYGTGISQQNFYNDLINRADDVAGSSGRTWNYYAGYGKANAFKALGGGEILINVTIDQKNSAGASVDSIHHWESGWDTFPVPKQFSWPENSQQVLRAKQDLLNGEKFHDWSGNTYVNHDSFEVKSNVTYLPAYLDEVNNSTVKTYLLSAGGADPEGDNVEFKDPWLIDYNDPPYGIRNQGMAAPFKTYPSPLNITLASEFKGVFLNQDYGDPGVPYYSVRAPQTQVIPFHGQDITWYFQGWKGEDVQFQHPQNTNTAVVFKKDGAVARAMYKGHLVSNHSTATETHSGR